MRLVVGLRQRYNGGIMNHISPSSSDSERPLLRPVFFILFVLLSLLLHLVAIKLPIQQHQADSPIAPAVVRLVDMPRPEIHREPEPTPQFEIDEQQRLAQPEEPVISDRRADFDQRIEQEQAPEADDVRDQTRAAEQVPVPQPPTPSPASPSVPTPPPTPAVQRTSESPQQSRGETLPPDSSGETTTAQPPTPHLTPEQLLPRFDVMERLAFGPQADRDRARERDDVDIGDTVWLNLQHDRLVSFFRRFHNKVERVWNYPVEAANNGMEGTLELMIIVSSAGELIDVDLRQSSGFDILDFEAIQAVYRAAPFGPLGRQYPHDELRIRAHFSYRISGRYIFGRQ